MYMRHNGACVGHCHNLFPNNEDANEPEVSDDEMETDEAGDAYSCSTEVGEKESDKDLKSNDSSEDLDDNGFHDNSSDGSEDEFDEHDEEIDTNLLF